MTKLADDSLLLLDHNIHLPTQTIYLTGDVDEDMYKTLSMGLTLIDSKKNRHNTVTIELNTPGGDWYSGMAIYDKIKSSELTTKIVATGSVMSMGSVILQSADIRMLGSNTTVMLHNGESNVEGMHENIEAWIKHFNKNNDKMYEIFAARGKKPIKFWKSVCKTDYIITAQEAIDLGLADCIL